MPGSVLGFQESRVSVSSQGTPTKNKTTTTVWYAVEESSGPKTGNTDEE